MGFPQHATPAAAGECCYNYHMANDGDDLQNGGMHTGLTHWSLEYVAVFSIMLFSNIVLASHPSMGVGQLSLLHTL